MSKPKINPRTLAQAAKIAGYHCKEVQEMALDVAHRMVRDQNEWLDGVMKDLLIPELYEAGQRGEREEEIATYAKKYGIEVIFIPDSQRIRVMCRGKVHAEFVPTFTVDGEPVSITPQFPVDGAQN